MIETEDMRRIVIEASDVLTVLARPQSAPKQDQNNPTDKVKKKAKLSQVGKMDSAMMETPQGTKATESSTSDSTPNVPQTTHIRSKQAATDHSSENPKEDNTEGE